MKRRLILFVGGLLGVLAVTWLTLSRDTCGSWPQLEPALALAARSKGVPRVGAARVAFDLPFPVPVGGYGPPHHAVSAAHSPLFARALVLDVGGQRKALVVLDAMLVTPQLRDRIAKDQPMPVITLATHTHSGPGAYSPNSAEEWAALGTYAPAVEQALVTAAREALAQAASAPRDVHLETATATTDGVTVARTGAAADTRLTRWLFVGEEGPVAQLLIVSAHPTLVGKNPDTLNGDWPTALAEELERDGTVTLVLQGAAGNASVNRAQLPTPEAVATKLASLALALPMRPQGPALVAAWSEIHVALPRPDASRVAPGFARAAVENALCDDAEDLAVVQALRLGDEKLLFVPAEPSFEAGRVLEEKAHATRVVSLADGYVGYVETLQAVNTNTGEAARQYFPPSLLLTLLEGAELAGNTTQ